MPDPRLSAESAYNTYKSECGEIVGSLLGVTYLNYSDHRVYVLRENACTMK